MAMKNFLHYIDKYCRPVSTINHQQARHKVEAAQIDSLSEENESISFSGPMGIKGSLIFLESSIILDTPRELRPLKETDVVCRTVPVDGSRTHVKATLGIVQIFPKIMQPMWYAIETYYLREVKIKDVAVDEKIWLNREYGRLHV